MWFIFLTFTEVFSFNLNPVRTSYLNKYEDSIVNKYRPSLFMASQYGLTGQGDLTKTVIESPSLNSRKITASIIVSSPINDVWSIITDYDNLAVHVPNLVKSYVIPMGTGLPPVYNTPPIALVKKEKIRIFQEGAQKIVGFDFRASLTMDMSEEIENEGRAMAEKKTLFFKLAESSMFTSFDGTWSVRYHSRSREMCQITREFVYRYKTALTYSVLVVPKGLVPVMALEWRIKEDVPINLVAMKIAAEKVTVNGKGIKVRSISDTEEITTQWGADETLGMYIQKKKVIQGGGSSTKGI